MKTTTFRIWESNKKLLDELQDSIEHKRNVVLSKNLILNEALKELKVKENEISQLPPTKVGGLSGNRQQKS